LLLLLESSSTTVLVLWETVGQLLSSLWMA
jgi:hypothetical protein